MTPGSVSIGLSIVLLFIAKKQNIIIQINYMDISLLSLVVFIIITLIFFGFPSVGKPILTFDMLANEELMKKYYSDNIRGLGLYMIVIVTTQFFLNSSYLTSKCGGNIGKNMFAAAIFTFIPWLFIFGVMIAVLIMFPGFKSAFSDVVGYYVVSFSANDVFSKILLGTDINAMIDKETDMNRKNELSYAAEAILKICGNKSIIINQMNPDNFMQIWDTLKPLMVQGAYENGDYKKQLLDLVVLKENIGEAMWYIYTAILISSIVYYNLASRGCEQDVNEVKARHDNYLKQQDEYDRQQKVNDTTTYVN